MSKVKDIKERIETEDICDEGLATVLDNALSNKENRIVSMIGDLESKSCLYQFISAYRGDEYDTVKDMTREQYKEHCRALQLLHSNTLPRTVYHSPNSDDEA